MSIQINFLLEQALRYLRSGNLGSAELLIKQIIKANPNHSEALRLYSVIFYQKGENNTALEIIQKAIIADRRNGVAFSNQGNIQFKLGMILEAVDSYEKAIKLTPDYAEAYSNLGNALQELGEINKAIDLYKKAISLETNNPEFFCNLGNAYWKLDLIDDARRSYANTIALAPSHMNALHNLAHLYLREFNFLEGWPRYEARWYAEEDGRSTPIKTSKPRWDGLPKLNRLFIWGEQGIGDQILHGSLLRDLEKFPQTKIISVDKKLVEMFARWFPTFKVVDKNIEYPEDSYDEHIPLGSLGQYLRPDFESFGSPKPLNMSSKASGNLATHLSSYFGKNINCGISWKSERAKLGQHKSIALDQLSPILKMNNINFINLQYGDIEDEIISTNAQFGGSIQIVEDVDLYQDIESLQCIIDACDIIITTSNTTAHIAGVSGKETLLLLPLGNSRLWYWHDINGVSLWYPSIRVFKQENLGDWSSAIEAVKAYLEKRFEI